MILGYVFVHTHGNLTKVHDIFLRELFNQRVKLFKGICVYLR